jgi:ribosomal protein S12 methylthiotransferase
MGQLKASSFDVVHESDDNDASIVIINTCGFIDNAKQESIDTILEFARAKTEGKIEKLIVTGCLSERYKPDLEKEIQNVDEFL